MDKLTILEIINQKGTIIGLITSLFKGMINLRKGVFRWEIFITDMVMAVVVGYVAWGIAGDYNNVVRTVFTIILSGNAFLIGVIIFDKDVMSSILSSFLKSKGIEININNKKNESGNNNKNMNP